MADDGGVPATAVAEDDATSAIALARRVTETPVAGLYESTRDVYKLGTAFLLIFTAFQTTSFFQAAVLKDLGFGDNLAFEGSALLYATLSVTIFCVPHFVRRVGPKRSIIMGSWCYVLFLACLVHIVPALYLLGSALDGVGAALLWTSQASLLTRYSSDARRNANSAIFNNFLQGSLLCGSTIAYVLVPSGAKMTASVAQGLFLILLCIVGAGSATLLSLNSPPPAKVLPSGTAAAGAGGAAGHKPLRAAKGPRSTTSTSAHGDGMAQPLTDTAEVESGTARAGAAGSSASAELTLCQSVLASFKLMTTRHVALMNVLVVYSGMGLSFWQVKYPQMVSGGDPDLPTLPSDFQPHIIAFLMICTGVAEIFSGLITPRLADRLGCRYMVGIGLGSYCTAFVLIWLNMISGLWTPSIYVAFVCSFFLGFADAAVIILSYSMVGRVFKGGNPHAMALMFFFKSIAAGIAFLYEIVLSPTALLVMLFLCAVPAGVCFTLVDLETEDQVIGAPAGGASTTRRGAGSAAAWRKLDDGPDDSHAAGMAPGPGTNA